MKAIMSLFMLMLAVTMVVPMAVADEHEDNTETGEDDSTNAEVAEMDTSFGAKMRLYQLERSLNNIVLRANAFIEIADARGANTTELKDIVAEFEVMIEQVQDAQASVTEGNNQAAIETFITIKHDARALVNEFRDAAKNLVRPGDRAQVARETQDETSIEADLRARIRLAQQEHRAARLEAALTASGINADELVERVREGQADAQRARIELRQRLADLPEETRERSVSALQETAERRRVQAIVSLERVEERLGEQRVRMEERARILEEQGQTEAATRIRLHWENRTGAIVETRLRLEQRDGELRERIEVREREREQSRSEMCAAISYGECNARTVGERCDPDSEAAGYECDRVDNGCYGICRADDDSDDDSTTATTEVSSGENDINVEVEVR